MEDREILELFREREESALRESEGKYGRYCYAIAYRILGNHEDAEECVNDALNAAWKSIPPQSPERLSTYLGRLTRQIAIDRVRRENAAKRGGAEVVLPFEELDECIPDRAELHDYAAETALSEELSSFLRALPPTVRQVFLRRYWYFDPISDIAASFGFGESKVKMMLARTRKKLAAHLKERGFLDETN